MEHPLSGRARELARSRTPFVHATVVRAQHPTSAHAGDTALVHADGAIEGFVGGTCTENAVRVHALEVLVTGEPLLLRVEAGDATTRRGEGAVTVANPCVSGGSVEIFLQPRHPAPRLLVVGGTPVARALAALGAPLGLAVESFDGDRGCADAEAVVVASHGRGEEPALEAALRGGVPYVALVASRVRAASVLALLDVDDEMRARVHSPAGLDLGGRTAAEIALSVLAELVASRAAAGGAATAMAVDPVCGMTVAVAPATPQSTRDGVATYFCCEHCRDTYA